MALPDSVELARAPIPTNDSERLLFRQSFEPLIRLDCRGDIRPGLAVAWDADSAGRVWTFTLRDGETSEAALIASSWASRKAAVDALGIESASAQMDGRLAVTVHTPVDSVPPLFADPALAISRSGDSTIGLTTGAVVLQQDLRSGLLEFRTDPQGDPRDALDRGADLLVTRDPGVVEYAARRPEFATFPLPWTRTYLVVQPSGAEPLQGIFTADSLRRSLARDAVRADARAAEPPFWWDHQEACTERPAPGTRSTLSRVVYIRGDEVARGLAERIVALAGGRAGLRTMALGGTEFASSLRRGVERAYIVAARHQTLAPCRELAEWPRDASIHPLIDTRAYAIVRSGFPAVTVEWDGTISVANDDIKGSDLP